MGTRAIILTPTNFVDTSENNEIVYNSITVAQDGYPSNILSTLAALLEENTIEEIMQLGSMSSMREKLNPNPLGFHSMTNPQEGVCKIYSRDAYAFDGDSSAKLCLISKLNERDQYASYVYLVNKDNEIYFNSFDAAQVRLYHSSEFKEFEENEDA